MGAALLILRTVVGYGGCLALPVLASCHQKLQMFDTDTVEVYSLLKLVLDKLISLRQVN